MQVFCWLRYSMTASIISSHTPFGLSLIDVQIGDNNPLTWVTGKMSLFYPRQSFVISGLLKSINLQCNTLVPLADGTKDLSTKHLMFQVTCCKNPFNLFFYLFKNLQKWKKGSIRNYEKKILRMSDASSTSHLSYQPREPAYHIVDCRISICLVTLNFLVNV